MGPSATSSDPLRPAWPFPSSESDFIPIGPWNTDGLIAVNPLHTEARSRELQDLIAAGYPVMFVAAGEAGPTIVADNAAGIRDAMRHLVRHGHRHIAFIAGSPEDMAGDTGARFQAYRSALQEFGLPPDEHLVAYGRHITAGGYDAMRRIMDTGAGRFASGAVAMFPGGTWYGPAIEAAQPSFQWGYIPFPGSNNPDDNKHLFGKYDQGWSVAAKTPNKDAALKYLTEFSDPANYQAFANAVGFIPTQPGATLNTQIGKEVAPYLANFLVGYEQYWVAPKGAGQYANPYASYFKPFGTYDDPKELADKVQADLQSGLDANK